MSDEARLSELLEQWEELRERCEEIPLEELCRHCPHLLEALRRQVSALLAFEPLNPVRPVPSADSIATVSASTEHAGNASPDRLSATVIPAGYTIKRELGRGGMGVVYEAEQRALRRPVALKMILAGGHAGSGDLERFQREAEAIARLQHPNIVQIHEVGEAGGLPYCILEYVPGGSLADGLRERPFSPLEAARFCRLLAAAVYAAHQAGVVHRDLKPGNILLARAGAENATTGSASLPVPLALCQPKITDFGLAKFLDVPAAGAPRQETASGSVLGTPSYMAPEQAQGRIREIGPAVDIYALGAILYEMLVGRPPFLADSIVETLDQVIHREPVPPRRLNPRIPRDLETICLKALEKDARRRYADALQMAEDLGRFLEGIPVRARPTGWPTHAWRWCRRHPALAAAAAVVGLLLGAVFLLSVGSAVREREHRRQLQIQVAEGSRDHARELRDRDEEMSALLWFARALAQTPEDAEALQAELRTELSASYRDLPVLVDCLEHGGPALAVSLAPDGRHLLTGGKQGAQLWDLHTGEVLRRFPHPGEVGTTAFVDGGVHILTAAGTTGDATLRRWELATARPVAAPVPINPQTWQVLPTPDGRYALSSSGDRLAHLEGFDEVLRWDLSVPQPQSTPLPLSGRTTVVDLDASGLRAATGGADGAVQVWNMKTAQPVGVPFRLPRPVSAIAFDPTGKWLLTGCGRHEDKATMAILFDLNTGVQRAVADHQARVEAIAFSPDGRMALTGDWDGLAWLWDTVQGRRHPAPLMHPGPLWSAAFSPDGHLVATACGDRTVHLWDTAGRRRWVPPLRHPSAVAAVLFTPDGKHLLTSADDGVVRRWRLPEVVTLWHDRTVHALAFHPQGKLFVTGGGDGNARLWDTQTGRMIKAPLAHPKGKRTFIADIAFRPGSPHFAVAWQDGTIQRFELPAVSAGVLAAPSPRGTSLKHGTYANRLAFTPEGGTLLTAQVRMFGEGTIRFWDADTGTQKGETLRLPGTAGLRNDFFLAPQGDTLVTLQALALDPPQSVVRRWHALTGQATGGPLKINRLLTAAALFPEGHILLAGDDAGSVVRWDLAKEETPTQWCKYPGPVERIAISPAGGRVAILGPRGIQQYDADGQPSAGLILPPWGSLRAIAYSPDGRLLLTMADARSSVDRAAWLWDSRTAKVFGPPLRHSGTVTAAVFSPDGQRVATAGQDGAVRLWPIPQPRAGDPGLLQEWTHYVTGLMLEDSADSRPLTVQEWTRARSRLARAGMLDVP